MSDWDGTERRENHGGIMSLAEDMATLTDALTALSGQITALSERIDLVEQVKNRQTTQKWLTNGIIVCLLLLVAFSGWQGRRDICRAVNQSNQENVALWQPLLEQTPLPVDPGPDATQEQRDDYERRLEQRTSFEERLDRLATPHKC